ncbi:hypothetical protein FGU46_04855 [Methanobacterium sp. CWC-01]|uniref:DUF1786 domain-containing protein n=1 Tax=Methanobacterium aridiramus TaxID=2584467 RepID=UPI00257906E6|nr:DUF1786 domain-containing protein [Methanobacterium sp. CWC-01]WJI09468.1 hypothetical protein FGU46_04855 [Methanobacterium sp. CWC-01]
MKILAIDVGTGTQDIMLYDSEEPIENAVKLVLPSPTRIIANKIGNHHHDIFLSGETMGGGPVTRAIKRHLDKGYRVVMTKSSARTVRDDLNEVRSAGIEIVDDGEEHPEIAEIKLGDIDLDILKGALQYFDVPLEFDQVGVAVQDHGFLKEMGDRDFRFHKIREKMNAPLLPEEFAFHAEAPDYFTRMQGVLRTLKGYKPTVMDSKFAALCGCTCDPFVEALENFVALDIGNGHTLAASFKDGKICGVFEHHTRMLTPSKIESFISRLVSGEITHEEVHEDGGHGAWVVEPIEGCEIVVATGPRRKIMDRTVYSVYNAAPAGDVMMVGPAGLIRAIMSKRG